MDLLSTSFLRSLRNEAGRQADFFARRDQDTSLTWRAIESMAHHCLTTRDTLKLILSSDQGEDPIIKGGE